MEVGAKPRIAEGTLPFRPDLFFGISLKGVAPNVQVLVDSCDEGIAPLLNNVWEKGTDPTRG
jgi:hypothetical protein